MYTWIGFPESDREVEIVRSRLPEVGGALANQVVGAVNRLRAMDLEKLFEKWRKRSNATEANDLPHIKNIL